MNQKPEQEKYYELSYYTISHPNPSFIHQHIVDAYAAQYADENTKPITLAFALIGLYLYIERNYSGKEIQKAHTQLAKKRKQWPIFNQPEQRGAVTVSDVLAAPPGSERDEVIRRWCASVWEAYRENHKKVADLVQAELPVLRKKLPPKIKINEINNMNKGLIAKASIPINASAGKVWDALTNPEVIKQYMFGTNVISEWKEGRQIIWKGEWQGKKYEDRGVILKLEPECLIQYSHFSPLSDKPDLPENYHTVTIELVSDGIETTVSLSQDNNEIEQAREHSEKNWKMMLGDLKKLLEK